MESNFADSTAISKISSVHSDLLERQTRTRPSHCRICGAPALYSYFGTVVCQSCKMFFKRNGERGRAVLSCDLDAHCEITEANRRTCSACRLAKCLSSGMRIEMIRSSRSKTKMSATNKKQQQQQQQEPFQVSKNETAVTPTDLARRSTSRIPTLSFFQSNHSLLTADQWNLLSNLAHCYDEHNGYSHAERFIVEQNALPIKVRFKSTPVGAFLTSTLNRAHTLFEKNQDFLDLCSHDRSVLLRTTATHVASLSVHIILTRAQLMDHPAFLKSHEILFGPITTILGKRMYKQVDCDTVVMKLILAILSFSTTTYSVYNNISAVNFMNMKNILKIQDTYTELLWRYLHFRYDGEQAVRRFLSFVRCILSVHEAIVEATEVRWYTDIVGNLIELTEHSLSLYS